MFNTPAEVRKYIADHDIAMVDLKVVGLAGQWLHITLPAKSIDEAIFEEGVGYDGSSGAGFGQVGDSDVAALPQVETAFVDPFCAAPTLSFICDTVAADSKQPVGIDPRTIAKRAVAYMRNSGIADMALMGPEFEFHVFDRVEVVESPYESSVLIECDEVENGGTTPAIARKRGYMRIPPGDQLHDLRSDIALTLEQLRIPVRYHHHEVGAPGQCEIEIDMADLLSVADRTMLIKYVVKNIARKHGKLATFMPKPVFGEAGNGMHVHQRLEKGGKNVFYDDSHNFYADLSPLALEYIGGLLLNGPALTGMTNPSTNSFKRLVEGYEAPVNLFFSLGNRSAAIRVPRYAVSAADKRIEYRPPDFTGNIYLSLASMLMAGLDGIQRKVDINDHPFGPYDVNVATADAKVRASITPLPGTLDLALEALREDHAFLVRGEVFAESFIQGWIKGKLENESREIASRPHPFEYSLYLDV